MTLSIHAPIKKNSIHLFRSHTKNKTKAKLKVEHLKQDFSFCILYVSMQKRPGDLQELFNHETQAYPPSLSDHGQLRFGKKSDLLECLSSDGNTDPPPSHDCKLIDGAAIVHALPTNSVQTFEDCAKKIFILYMQQQLKTCKRLDVVWDVYVNGSLKESARAKRGSGKRLRVRPAVQIPGKWSEFLSENANKQDLFVYLSLEMKKFNFPTDKEVNATYNDVV